MSVAKARSTWLILGVAALVRVLWSLSVPVIPVSDALAYHTFAVNLSQSGVYGWTPDQPSAFWAPGTSLIYAAVYWLLGSSGAVVALINIVVGVLLVYVTIRLATAWFGERVGLLTGVIMALYPTFVMYTTLVASEPMFMVTLVVALLLFEGLRGQPNLDWRVALGLGLVTGAAMLLRPIAMFFPAILLGLLLLERRSVVTLAKTGALIAIGMALVVGPWTLRNHVVFHQWVLVSTSGGTNFWMGNNPDTTGFYQPPPAMDGALDEVERDRILGRQALDYVVAEPVAFIQRTLVKAARLYESETIGVVWNQEALTARFGAAVLLPLKLVSQACWLALLALFVAGCGLAWRSQGRGFLLHPAVAIMAFSTAFYAVFVIQDRYHVPTNALMAIFAALAIERAHAIFRQRRDASAA